MSKRSILKIPHIALLLGLALTTANALAQPKGRPIRVVVPLGAGTISDSVTRLLAPHMSTALGETVVVENKPGANAVIGVMDVVKSPPDGTTLLLGSISVFAINVALVKDLPYDPNRDLTAISGAYIAHHVLAVKSTFPARNFAEFIAYAKKNPGKVTAGSASTLTEAQVNAMNTLGGIQLLSVPYKSTTQTYTDVLGGTLDLAFFDLLYVQGQKNQLRVLAVSTLKRNPIAPDWPAASETLPGYDFGSWSAFVGPAGMSRDLVNRFSAAIISAVRNKDINDKLQQAGHFPWTTTPDELKTHIASEAAKWVKLAKDYNMPPI